MTDAEALIALETLVEHTQRACAALYSITKRASRALRLMGAVMDQHPSLRSMAVVIDRLEGQEA
jgi:hypothetical protein